MTEIERYGDWITIEGDKELVKIAKKAKELYEKYREKGFDLPVIGKDAWTALRERLDEYGVKGDVYFDEIKVLDNNSVKVLVV